MQISRFCLTATAVFFGLGCCAQATGQLRAELSAVRAHLRPITHHFPVGQPVWVQFSIENLGDEQVTLSVPGTEPEIPQAQMGLPISHVFSGNPSSGVCVTTDSGRRLEKPVGYRAGAQAPILIIAGHSTVGTKLDLRDYFPVLRGAGQYRLAWKPYGGRISSDVVSVTIAPRKQAEIVTDEGTMTIRFYYEDAPGHVANFIELVKSGFYTNKTFHRLEPGYMLMGGCPRGDGTGIRPNGARLPAEFNSRPHQKGSVSMALLEDDPDSASCQFFLCYTRQKDWDGRYTVFGQLEGEESMAILDRLMATPVDEESRPRRVLYMRTVRLIDAPVERPSGMP